MLYRDIMAPQPPMHFWAGEAIVHVTRALGVEMIRGFRAFSLLVHLATMVCVYLAAVRIAAPRAGCRCGRAAGLWAAGAYMVLPLGFWWTLGYQSEPLEMLFMMASFVLFLSWKPGRAAASGALMALAPLTNMTAAPYTLFNIGYLAVRRPRLALAYALPIAGIITAVVVGMEWRTGAYLENVILNQVGSFPRPEFLPPGQTLLTYAWGKIVNEGTDVLRLEAGWIVIGLLGLLRFARRGEPTIREYATFYAFFALCSILYVSKGGTVDYIFTIGEPFLAVFAGYFCWHFSRKHFARWWAGFGWRNLSAAAGILAGSGLAVVLLAPGIAHSWGTLQQRSYELPEYETARIVEQIRKNSRPDGLILAPPMYAFLAERRLAEDYSELLLWMIKYKNEVQDKQPGRAVKTSERIGQLLAAKKVDFVVLDMGQTARIPPIKDAIDRFYEPVRQEEYRTLNTRLMFYRPKP